MEELASLDVGLAKRCNVIEVAHVSDIDAILGIEKRTNITPWSRQMLLDTLVQDNNYHCFISKNKVNEVCAYLIVQQLLNEASLLHIVVDVNMQSQGIGRQLLQYWLKSLNSAVKTIWLEVRESNVVAQSLYQSCGFVKSGERKNYYRLPNSAQKEMAFIYCLKRSN